MTPAQCRAARGLIRWTQPDLASAAGVSDVTVRKFENEQSVPQRASLDVMRRALEAAGCIFIAENGEGPGVRLRKHGRGRGEVRILEEAARMFEADHPGMKFEGSTRPTATGQGTEILADPGQRAAYIAKAEQKLAEEGR